MRVHFILTATGNVVNTVEQADLSCPFQDQHADAATATSDIGWTWTGPGQYTAPPAPAPTEADFVNAIQVHLDAEARTRNYDGILSACSYATSTNAKFKAEALACVAWRDAVWAYGYQQLAAVQGGTRPLPTVAQLLAELPAMGWPA